MLSANDLKAMQGATAVRTAVHQDVNYIESYRLSASPSRSTTADLPVEAVVASVLEGLQRTHVRLTSEELREAEGDSV
jgi:hypothetical protein